MRYDIKVSQFCDVSISIQIPSEARRYLVTLTIKLFNRNKFYCPLIRQSHNIFEQKPVIVSLMKKLESTEPYINDYFSHNQHYLWKRIKHTLISKVRDAVNPKKNTPASKITDDIEAAVYGLLKNIAKVSMYIDESGQSNLEESSKLIQKYKQKYEKGKDINEKLLSKLQEKKRMIKSLEEKVYEEKLIKSEIQHTLNKLKNNSRYHEKQNKKKTDKLVRENQQLRIQISRLSDQDKHRQFISQTLADKLRYYQKIYKSIQEDNTDLRNQLEKKNIEKECMKGYAIHLSQKLEQLSGEKQPEKTVEKVDFGVSVIIDDPLELAQIQRQYCRQKTEYESLLIDLKEELINSEKYIKELEDQLGFMEKVGYRVNKYLEMKILGNLHTCYDDHQRVLHKSAIMTNQQWGIHDSDVNESGDNPINRKSFNHASNPQLIPCVHNISEKFDMPESLTTNHTSYYCLENSILENCSNNTPRLTEPNPFTQKLDSVIAERQQLKGQIQGLRREQKISQERQRKLKEEGKIISEEKIKKEQQMIKKQQQKITDLQCQVMRLKNQKQKQLAISVQQKYSLEGQLQKLSIANSQHSSEVLSSQQLIKDLSLKIQQFQQIKFSLQGTIEAKNRKIEELQADITIGQELYLDTQAQLGILSSKIGEKSHLQQQIQQLNHKIAEKDELIQEYRKKLIKYEDCINQNCSNAFELYQHLLAEKGLLVGKLLGSQKENQIMTKINEKQSKKILELKDKLQKITKQKSDALEHLKILSDRNTQSVWTQTEEAEPPQISDNSCELCQQKNCQIQLLESYVDAIREQKQKNRCSEKKIHEDLINMNVINKYLLEYCDTRLSQYKRNQSLLTLSEVLKMNDTERKAVEDYIRRKQLLFLQKNDQNKSQPHEPNFTLTNQSVDEGGLPAKLYNFLTQE